MRLVIRFAAAAGVSPFGPVTSAEPSSIVQLTSTGRSSLNAHTGLLLWVIASVTQLYARWALRSTTCGQDRCEALSVEELALLLAVELSAPVARPPAGKVGEPPVVGDVGEPVLAWPETLSEQPASSSAATARLAVTRAIIQPTSPARPTRAKFSHSS